MKGSRLNCMSSGDILLNLRSEDIYDLKSRIRWLLVREKFSGIIRGIIYITTDTVQYSEPRFK